MGEGGGGEGGGERELGGGTGGETGATCTWRNGRSIWVSWAWSWGGVNIEHGACGWVNSIFPQVGTGGRRQSCE